jgi:peptidyl-prolyl cis-trans isomerase C
VLRCHFVLSFAVAAALGAAALAQQPTAPQAAGQLRAPVPSSPDDLAATVNGRPIPEVAVARALRGKTDVGDEKRNEVVNYLIDNALVDQYLEQMRISVDAKEIDTQWTKVKEEVEATGKKMPEFLDEMRLTEAELRTQIFATLRWDRFIQQYASEKTLKEFFDGNTAMFDGTSMRARHILLMVPTGNAKAAEEAKAKIGLLKMAIESKVAKGLAEAGKLDNLELQKKRMQLLESAFAEVAATQSDCPSKHNGGELGWFPRTGGKVVEPFAKVAFTLKPWEMSDAVATEFGYHLILCVDFKPGVERKLEEIRDVVRDVYADRMREAIIARMRPTAKITINPAPK